MELSDSGIARLASEVRIDQLVLEIGRYLDAVDTFRELGHEPSWRPEGPSPVAARISAWLDLRESQMSGV